MLVSVSFSVPQLLCKAQGCESVHLVARLVRGLHCNVDSYRGGSVKLDIYIMLIKGLIFIYVQVVNM